MLWGKFIQILSGASSVIGQIASLTWTAGVFQMPVHAFFLLQLLGMFSVRSASGSENCSPIRCMAKYGGVEPVESVAQRFAEETGLKLKFAKMWVEEAGGDYERALKEFEEAKAEGKIAPEGFEEK